MYKITRQEASEILGVSTRSIDRYIKWGKLRSQKEGKIIYIHKGDIESIWGNKNSHQEVIIPRKTPEASSTHITPNWGNPSATLERIYTDLRSEIQKKDSIIQDLSTQLWETKEIAKNSISLIEFKKSQFLLEESKWHLGREVQNIQEAKNDIEKQLKYEKSTNYILITFVVVLFITLGFVWFIKI